MAGNQVSARDFRGRSVAPPDTEKVTPPAGDGPSHPLPVRQDILHRFPLCSLIGISLRVLEEIAPFRRAGGGDEHENLLSPGGHPAPADALSAPDGQAGLLVIDIQDIPPYGRLDPALLAVQEAEGPDAASVRQAEEHFSAQHHAVLRPPFRRKLAGVTDVFSVFRQRAAGESRLVRTPQDGPRFAPEDGPAVHPVGEAIPVPVLAEGMDPVFTDEESPQGFPPLEPEKLHPVPGNDRLRPVRTVGIEVSAHVPVHVRMHASVGRDAPHEGPVPV